MFSERLITSEAESLTFRSAVCFIQQITSLKKKKKVLQITDRPLTGRILSRQLCGDKVWLKVSGCSVSNTCPLTGFSLYVFCSAPDALFYFFLFFRGGGGGGFMRGSLSRGAFYHPELQPKSLLFQKEPDGWARCTHTGGFCFPRHSNDGCC